MDVWMISLLAVLWYAIGVWGSVRGLRREKAQYGTKIDIAHKTFGTFAALVGPVNLLIVLIVYHDHPKNLRR